MQTEMDDSGRIKRDFEDLFDDDWIEEDEDISGTSGDSGIDHLKLELDAERKFSNMRRMPAYGWFLILFIFGGAILATPAIYLLLKDNQLYVDVNQLGIMARLPDPILQTESQVVRWSLFLTAEWLVVVTFWYVIVVAPRMIIASTRWFYNVEFLSERFRGIMEMIPKLRFWILLVIGCGFALIFHSILFPHAEAVPYWLAVFKILSVTMVFSVFLLMQRMFIQRIATDFHRTAYDHRIRESKASVRVIDKLRRGIQAEKGIDIFHFSSKSTKNMTLVENPVNADQETARSWQGFLKSIVVRRPEANEDTNSVKLSMPFDTIANQQLESQLIDSSNQTLNSAANATSAVRRNSKPMPSVTIGGESYGEKIKKVRGLSEKHAQKLSRNLFVALGGKPNEPVCIEAFHKYFKSFAAAKEAFKIFDKDRNGTITELELVQTIKFIMKERRAIFSSLHDLSKALGQLNFIMYGVSIVFTVLVSLIIFGVELNAVVIPFTSMILAVSFGLSTVAQGTFECIFFIFSMHPYDSGDRVIIEGQNLKVIELQLLHTVFEATTGQRITAPNQILSKKFITNLRRSSNETEWIKISIDFKTKDETIKELEKRMVLFTKHESKEFLPSCEILVNDVAASDYVLLQIAMRYRGNCYDERRRIQRKNKFLAALRTNLIQLNIQYNTMPIHIAESVSKPIVDKVLELK